MKGKYYFYYGTKANRMKSIPIGLIYTEGSRYMYTNLPSGGWVPIDKTDLELWTERSRVSPVSDKYRKLNPEKLVPTSGLGPFGRR